MTVAVPGSTFFDGSKYTLGGDHALLIALICVRDKRRQLLVLGV